MTCRCCNGRAVREGLCVPHALTWLFSRDSAPGPGRAERLESFVKRQNMRAALRGSEARNFNRSIPDNQK